MKLDIPFPYNEIYDEIYPFLDQFKEHRPVAAAGMWKGLCLRGSHWFRPGDSHPGDPELHWTEFADILDVTTEYFKNFPVRDVDRIRFMLLEPGGTIPLHSDISYPRLCSAINFCINQPKDCDFIINGQTIPWKPGDVRLMNVHFKHTVINNSQERRLHMILHGKGLRTDKDFQRIVLNSYEKYGYKV